MESAEVLEYKQKIIDELKEEIRINEEQISPDAVSKMIKEEKEETGREFTAKEINQLNLEMEMGRSYITGLKTALKILKDE